MLFLQGIELASTLFRSRDCFFFPWPQKDVPLSFPQHEGPVTDPNLFSVKNLALRGDHGSKTTRTRQRLYRIDIHKNTRCMKCSMYIIIYSYWKYSTDYRYRWNNFEDWVKVMCKLPWLATNKRRRLTTKSTVIGQQSKTKSCQKANEHTGTAMVRLGSNPLEFEREIHARCSKVYDLLISAARPVLQHGLQQEASGLRLTHDSHDWCDVTPSISKLTMTEFPLW